MSALRSSDGLELPALNGANPLGFLAALGTLITLRQEGHPDARLGWRRTIHWTPMLHGLATRDPQQIAQAIAGALRGKEVPVKAEAKRESAQRGFDAAKQTLHEKLEEIK